MYIFAYNLNKYGLVQQKSMPGLNRRHLDRKANKLRLQIKPLNANKCRLYPFLV